ncbi:lymphocyte antigen 75-like [Athalia rosae]|uniref:lymphocyte antigen 75-like n=1 Tax=Athalia rosae TaxID=37344 RepID=UPI002033690F|nr:lymphocyte antigen 75-like [Athalia rosae]
MSGILATLPLHLACQLMTHGYNGTVNVSQADHYAHLANQTTELSGGYTIFPELGVAYKFYKNKLTWNAARKQCISEGASLAIIDSFRKIDYLMTIKDKALGLHTGMHRLFDTSEWTNIRTGQPMHFIPWKSDVNLNASPILTCSAMWNDGSGVGPWNCISPLPSVCEKQVSRTEQNSESDIHQNVVGAFRAN